MKKICFVVFNLSYIGGIERVNSVITSMLATNPNYDITLLSLFGKNNKINFSEAIIGGVNIRGLMKEPIPIRKNAFKIIKEIETEILLNQYEIVVVSELKTYFSFAKLKKIVLIKTNGPINPI